MSAHAYRKDDNNAQAKRMPRGKPKQTQKHDPKRVAEIESRLGGMRDGEERIARLEALQKRINAGTYTIDSQTLAQKMLSSPRFHHVLGLDAEIAEE